MFLNLFTRYYLLRGLPKIDVEKIFDRIELVV